MTTRFKAQLTTQFNMDWFFRDDALLASSKPAG